MSRTSAFHVVAVLSFVLPAFLLTGCGGVPVHKTASGMVIAEAGYTSRLPSPDHEPITLPADNAIYVSLEENQPTVSGASQWKHTLRFWDTGQVLWVNELWLENSGAAGRLDTTPQPDIVSFESEHDLAGNAVAGAYVVDGSDIYIQILERVLEWVSTPGIPWDNYRRRNHPDTS